MDDVLARLSAELEEDETLARECIDDSPHWMATPDGVDQYETGGGSSLFTGYFNQGRRPLANYHIARHDPARVLRYVAAIREVLESCACAEKDVNASPGALTLADAILFALAGIYTPEESS